jgi:hypothetical protein
VRPYSDRRRNCRRSRDTLSSVPQPYHPSLPHIVVSPHPQGGFIVRDTRTGEAAHAPTRDAVARFAADHSARPGYGGLGDAVHAMTSAVGVKPCTPCAARQARLNALVPGLWRRR